MRGVQATLYRVLRVVVLLNNKTTTGCASISHSSFSNSLFEARPQSGSHSAISHLVVYLRRQTALKGIFTTNWDSNAQLSTPKQIAEPKWRLVTTALSESASRYLKWSAIKENIRISGAVVRDLRSRDVSLHV